MIEILKSSKWVERKHFRCRHCESEWLAGPGDYKVEVEKNFRNPYADPVNWYQMKCPICGWELLIGEKDDINYLGEMREPG